MEGDQFKNLIGKKFIGLSIVLTLIFWATFTWILVPFVPGDWGTTGTYLLSGYAATCLTGVFFLALYMFQLVLVDYRRSRA